MDDKPKMEPWMSTWHPFGGDAYVLPIKEEQRESAGGIVMPERSLTTGRKQIKGFVFAVGPGHVTSEGVLIPNKIEVGMVVLFCPAAEFQDVTVDGHIFYQVSFPDMIGWKSEVIDAAPPEPVE